MANKIIMLDIDGILNSKGSLLESNLSADLRSNTAWGKREVIALKKLLRASGAKIVIHSSWRMFHTLDELKQMFKERGVNPKFILDTTPVYYDNQKPRSIREWLKENPDVEHYVILDDHDMEDKAHQVFVDSDHGLSWQNVEDACKILEVNSKLPLVMF